MSEYFIVVKYFNQQPGETQLFCCQSWTPGSRTGRTEHLNWVLKVKHATRFVDPNTAAGVVARITSRFPDLKGRTMAIHSSSLHKFPGGPAVAVDPGDNYDRAMRGL